MKSRMILWLVFYLLFVPRAWAGDWSTFRKDALRSGRSTELVQPPLSVQWTFAASEAIVSSATVSSGKVFVGSRDNHLYALDEATGGLLWKVQTAGWVDSSPAVTAEAVYFTSRDGYLYCVDVQTGSLLWKYQTGGTDCSSPLVSGGLVFCASAFPNKFIYALNADTGVEVWRQETDQMVYSSAALSGDNLYIGSNDCSVYCLDKATGAVRWQYQTKGGIYYASPAIDEDRLFIGSGNFDWSIYALALDSGSPLWKHEVVDKQSTPTYVSSVAVGDGVVFIVSGYAQQYLYCLVSSSGALKWKAQLGPATRLGFSSSPAVTEDVVYVVSAEGRLSAHEITTGNLVWSESLGSGVLSSPAVANGRLYIGTLDGNLLALE